MVLRPAWRAEISRKVLHLSTALIPIAYAFVDRRLMLTLLAGGVSLAIVVEIGRNVSAGFRAVFRRTVGFMVRSREWNRVCGSTYVLLGALLSVWLFPQPAAMVALLILSVSDTAASLVGLSLGRTRFLGKSMAGSFAFFVTALAILCATYPDTLGIAFTTAVVATLAEALPALKLGRIELNDNITIPLLTGGSLWFLDAYVESGRLAALLF